MIILESFGQEFVGALNPQLEGGRYKGGDALPRFAHRGEHHLRALICQRPQEHRRHALGAFVDPHVCRTVFLTPASLNHLSGLAGELDKENYETAFFHGAQNGSMGFEAFSRSTGFNKYYGRTEFEADTRFGGKDEFDGTWAIGTNRSCSSMRTRWAK